MPHITPHEKLHINVIVGLGNPDPELRNTYHNAGMRALPAIAAALSSADSPVHTDTEITFRRHKNSFAYARVGPYVFVEPLTYMNESGRAVKDALTVFEASPETLVVAHDDSDLPVGSFKIARGGGAAGHKGILSIIDHVHTRDFVRIRIGIRDPHESSRKKAGAFVLSPITPDDMHALETTYRAIGKALATLIAAS